MLEGLPAGSGRTASVRLVCEGAAARGQGKDCPQDRTVSKAPGGFGSGPGGTGAFPRHQVHLLCHQETERGSCGAALARPGL